MNENREVWEQLARYRKVKTLPDGSRLLLRPLQKGDKQALVDLFARASREDLEWYRIDAADPKVVESWVDNLDYRRVFPLVAFANDRLIGEATLHFGEHYHRHLAWVRIFLDKKYRRQGIGTLMVQSLIEIARRVGLRQLYGEIVTTQPQVIQGFLDMGFQHEVTLRDYFITSEGETLDMAIVVLRLVDDTGRF
ncbi:MAG TPA: GNAT family N-acetyltransferase [Thermoflexia bacterium]|jgi:RimJ/RimL family protein N-acetyltransferase|nr:GNAT family N-acetyltransferase [Thermoflexia bacterium]